MDLDTDMFRESGIRGTTLIWLTLLLIALIGYFDYQSRIPKGYVYEMDIPISELTVQVPVMFAVAELEAACRIATKKACLDVMYAFEYEEALEGLLRGDKVFIGFKPHTSLLLYEIQVNPNKDADFKEII